MGAAIPRSFRGCAYVVNLQRCTHQPSWAGGAVSYRAAGEHLTHARDFGAVVRLAPAMSEVVGVAGPAGLRANAALSKDVEPLGRSGGRLLDRRTWAESVSTPTQHLLERVPSADPIQTLQPGPLSGASSINHPKSATSIAHHCTAVADSQRWLIRQEPT